MESMVDRVRDVLSECVLHSTTSDVGVLDRIVVSLANVPWTLVIYRMTQ